MRLGVEDVVLDDRYSKINLQIGGRKPKSSGLFDSCRICTCSFAIRLRSFGTTSHVSTENLFVEPKCEGLSH